MGDAAGNANTFEPSSDLIQEDNCNTLLLYLPGFTREQLRVQLTRSRVLKISGSRPLGQNKWSSFQKDFPVSENCDTNRITAKFEEGILYITQPKLIVPADKDDRKTPPSETSQPHEKPAEKPPAPKTDQGRQQTTKIATPRDGDRTKQTGAKDLPGKSSEDKEEKATKDEEKSSEPEAGKKDETKYEAERTTEKAAAAKSDRDERGKISGTSLNGVAKGYDYERVIDAVLSPAARLKMAREKMMNVLLLLFVIALGIYVSNLPWFSRKAEN